MMDRVARAVRFCLVFTRLVRPSTPVITQLTWRGTSTFARIRCLRIRSLRVAVAQLIATARDVPEILWATSRRVSQLRRITPLIHAARLNGRALGKSRERQNANYVRQSTRRGKYRHRRVSVAAREIRSEWILRCAIISSTSNDRK